MAAIDLKTNLYNGASEAVFVGDKNGNEVKTISLEELYRLYYSFSSVADTGGFSFDVALFINGNLFSVNSIESVNPGNWWWYYCWDVSFQPGTYTATMVIDPENKIAETNEANNTCTVTITVDGCSDYLMDTFWSQNGTFLGDSEVELNAYCPIEPGAVNHSVTGCCNTAAAQIFYYFAQNGNLFTLQLNETDSNTANPNITIDASAANAQRYGYLEFSEVNEKLYEFDVNSAEDTAALVFASGVIADSCYSEYLTSTYTSGIKEVFERAGFHGLKMDGVGSDLIDRNSILTDLGWAMIKENIAAGKPVYTSIPNPAHAVVIDGYDAETDSVHINFGWGFWGNKEYSEEYDCYNGSGWYTRAECADLKINGLLYNITPDTVAPGITINVSDPVDGSVTVSADFSDDVGVYETWYKIIGTSDEWQEYTGAFSVTNNCTIAFKAVDKGKNSTTQTVRIDSLFELIENKIVGDGETFTIDNNKRAQNTTVNAGGIMVIEGHKTTATNTIVNVGGELRIKGLATADGVVENGGWVELGDRATVIFTANSFNDLTVTGKCSVHENTVANGTTLESGSSLYVYDGGIANNTTIIHGYVNVFSGGLVDGLTLSDAGYLNLYSGGTVENVIAGGYAYLGLESGSYINGLTFNGKDGNCVSVYHDVTVENVVVNSGGLLVNGGSVDSVIVNQGGTVEISGCDSEVAGIRENGGFVKIHEENPNVTFTANKFRDLTITDKCSVHSGTVAENITVAENGELHIYSGGEVWNTEICKGSLTIHSGAVHYGTLLITQGSVDCEAGGIINLDLTGRSADDGYCVTRVGGSPTYAVTVSADQSFGEYKLVERAGAAPVSTFIIGDGTTEFGTITIDSDNRNSLNKVCYNGINYIIVCNDNHFDLKVVEVAPPEKPIAVVSTIGYTNKPVTVTPEFAEDSVKNEYSYDGQYWMSYSDGYVFEFSENKTIYFRSTNAVGDVSEVTGCAISNIDTQAPDGSGYVKVTGSGNSLSLDWTEVFSDSGSGIENYIVQIIDGSDLKSVVQEFSTTGTTCSTTLVDGKYYCYVRALDHAGNLSDKVSGNNAVAIETGAPGVPKDFSAECSKSKVTLVWGEREVFDISLYEFQVSTDAAFTDIVKTDTVSYSKTSAVFDLADGKYYIRLKANDRSDNSSAWSETVTVTVDTIAPILEISGNPETWTCNDVVLTASANEGTIEYFDGSNWVVCSSVTVYENGEYTFRATDDAGNQSEKTVVVNRIDRNTVPQNLAVSGNILSWSGTVYTDKYFLELISGESDGVLRIDVDGTQAALYSSARKALGWQLSADGENWMSGGNFTVTASESARLVSDGDGSMDVFFASVSGLWNSCFNAVYQGGNGIENTVALTGKNKIADIFSGSEDADILLLTDDACGDALFLDDIYSAFGEQARLSQIDEIRAGAGDDVVDLTSAIFTFESDGVTVYGGAGNDVIWANSGSNLIFGDGGNDNIIGGMDDDIISGGIGNDTLHGGGGADIFCFGGDWGIDVVEQSADGSVTLCFEENNGVWDEGSFTYTCGENRLTVSGTTDVTIIYGVPSGMDERIFANAASEDIFEKNKGTLA